VGSEQAPQGGLQGAAEISYDGGSAWTDENEPQGTTLDALVCPTPTSCVAFGTYNYGAGAVMATESQDLTVSAAPVPDATVGKGYLVAVHAAGGDQTYDWSLVAGNLPDGLSVSPSGIIFGTPASVGLFTFTLGVVDHSTPVLKAARSYSLAVKPSISPSSMPSGSVGQRYLLKFRAKGTGPGCIWSISHGRLPRGISLRSSGELIGTPAIGGTVSFTVRLEDRPLVVSATRSYSLTILRAKADETRNPASDGQNPAPASARQGTGSQ
jgi:hypothetical protein